MLPSVTIVCSGPCHSRLLVAYPWLTERYGRKQRKNRSKWESGRFSLYERTEAKLNLRRRMINLRRRTLNLRRRTLKLRRRFNFFESLLYSQANSCKQRAFSCLKIINSAKCSMKVWKIDKLCLLLQILRKRGCNATTLYVSYHLNN